MALLAEPCSGERQSVFPLPTQRQYKPYRAFGLQLNSVVLFKLLIAFLMPFVFVNCMRQSFFQPLCFSFSWIVGGFKLNIRIKYIATGWKIEILFLVF